MTIKPILKWVGGKTQILPQINSLLEKISIVNNYYEIFLGGGSTLLNFLQLVKDDKIKLKGQVYAYDINMSLIYVYKNIQTDYKIVYKYLEELIHNFNEDISLREKYYYDIRKFYNDLTEEHKITPLGSAVFIFLNKTGFRGMFREGPHGFNIPYGNYKNPEIVNLEHLEKFSELIQDVIFECKSFNESMLEIDDSDIENFVYLDPPYVPENSTSFTKYTKEGFNMEQHLELFDKCQSLITKGVKILMSNSDTELVNQTFSKQNLEKVIARRSINAKNPESKTIEVLISNF